MICQKYGRKVSDNTLEMDILNTMNKEHFEQKQLSTEKYLYYYKKNFFDYFDNIF